MYHLLRHVPYSARMRVEFRIRFSVRDHSVLFISVCVWNFIVFKWLLGKCRENTRLSEPVGTVVGFCKHASESSGSLEAGNFLKSWIIIYASTPSCRMWILSSSSSERTEKSVKPSRLGDPEFWRFMEVATCPRRKFELLLKITSQSPRFLSLPPWRFFCPLLEIEYISRRRWLKPVRSKSSRFYCRKLTLLCVGLQFFCMTVVEVIRAIGTLSLA